jgi:proteic killer suppression protein
MIEDFSCKDSERLFQRQPPKKLRLPSQLWQKAYEKLVMLHAARTVYDLYNPPSNYFEALEGTRKGSYSIRIDSKWRICFRFENGHASDVEIVDYH